MRFWYFHYTLNINLIVIKNILFVHFIFTIHKYFEYFIKLSNFGLFEVVGNVPIRNLLSADSCLAHFSTKVLILTIFISPPLYCNNFGTIPPNSSSFAKPAFCTFSHNITFSGIVSLNTFLRVFQSPNCSSHSWIFMVQN